MREDYWNLIRNYSNDDATTIEDEKEEKEKEKKGKKFLRRIILFIIAKFFIICLLLLIFFIPLFLFLILGGMFGGNRSGNTNIEYSSDYGNDFKSLFGNSYMDIPYGIPIERGVISYGFDYQKYNKGSPNGFIKIKYPGANEYYPKHQGIDFAKTYKDKVSGYNPVITSTLRGFMKEYEFRDEDYNYTKVQYNDGQYYYINSTTTKSKEKKTKPYGLHMIISSLDGKYYTMYAHMSEINTGLKDKTLVDRGDPVGRLGNTGNSTGPHLHYEIRYCGENNLNIQKNWWDCAPINPLGFFGDQGISYIGFKQLPKANYFTAGSSEVIEGTQSEATTYNEIKKQKETDCRFFSLFLFGKENSVSCNEYYPIYYISKDNTTYPEIKDINERRIVGKQYVYSEYNLSTLSAEKIKEISKLEGIMANSEEDLFNKIGAKYSYGKFLNKSKIYLIRNISAEEKIGIEKQMMIDSIKDFSKIKEKTDIEDSYIQYFHNASYNGKYTNPYVYNMMDKDHLFMNILDSEGNIIGKYNKEGVLVIFNKIR